MHSSGKHTQAGGRRWLYAWLLAQAAACGHVGIDLEGSDASLSFDAARDQGDAQPQSQTKPPNSEGSRPNYTETSTEPDSYSDALNTDDGSTYEREGGVELAVDAGLDASVDGSVDAALDAALDSRVDAGVLDAGDISPRADAGGVSDGTTAIPLADDNAYTCDPLCECAAEDECELECRLPDCHAKCAAGGQCKIHSGDATTVTVECAEGASCSAAGTAPVVHMICKGNGECTATCLEGQKCDIDCVGTGKCVALCSGNATCHVNCAAESHCYVSHDATAYVDLACVVDSVECGVDLLTCNGECP